MDFHSTIRQLIQLPSFVTSLLGEMPLSLSPIEGGTVSAVYRATLHDDSLVVLKFSENAEELRHEQRFLAAWSAQGVRTPRVWQYDPLPEGLQGAVLLMEHVPGHNLLPLVNSGAVDSARVMVDLGRILATLHQVTVSGYGQVNLDANGEISGDSDSLRNSLRAQAWVDLINENRQNGDLVDDEMYVIDRAIGILSHHEDKPGGCLIHGDFRAGNILYDSSQPQPYTVIDPHPEISHPYLCLAYSLILSEIYGCEDHSRYKRQGYEMITPLDDDALHAARFLKALELLPRWGQPDNQIAAPLRQLFHQEKAWLLRRR